MLDSSVKDFYSLIVYRIKEKTEEKLYQRWILEGYSKQISFVDYKNELNGNKKEIKNNDKKERKLSARDHARFNRLDV